MAPAHRRTKSSGPPPPPRTLVIDNGAYTMKAGFSAPDTPTETPRIIPNCMARDRDKKVYIGSQLENCKDFGEIVFRRPVEKGYLVNWEAEKEIWEHEFFDNKAPLHCDPKDTSLILTEAPNNLPALQTNCDQIVFEEFGFASYLRCPAPSLMAYNDVQQMFGHGSTRRDPSDIPYEILLVIDSGYSHTTVTPLIQGRPLQSAIRRLDVGGKLLTNHLTHLLSLRQYDMRNDTFLVNQIKEATCFVSQEFKQDMERTWKGPKGDRRPGFAKGELAKDYVLPDYNTRSEGYHRDHDPDQAGRLKKLQTGKPAEAVEDVVTLRNERFTVPELLFSPTDIGIRQSGIAQLVMESLSGLPHGLWPGFLANIILVGGNAKIGGFLQRLQMEMRALAPAECIVRITKPIDPIVATWSGGAELARDSNKLANMSVTKQEYDENGSAWVARKFAGL